jgi:Siphovirus ReqiPepy6 Gp37-like protein
MLEISIFDTSFTRVAIIDDYSYFSFVRNFRRPNTFELRINRYKDDAQYLTIGNYVVVYKGGAYRIWRIESMEIELTDGRGSEVWIIKGRSLSGVFEDRLCLNKITNSSSGGYDTKTAPVETLMKYFVNVEVVNPTNTDRKIPNYVIATDQGRGVTVTASGRLQTVAELLETISFSNGIGYLVYFDLPTKKFVFEVIVGVDRSVGNGVNTPVLFSPDFDNIERLYFKNSKLGVKNYAIVGGQGDGKDRMFEEVGTATGFDRRETFVDARDLETEDGLIDRGNERLAEYAEELIMEFDHTQIGPFVYEVDFNLGDIVTVVYPGIVEMNTRIIRVDENYTHEYGWRYKFTVGSEFPDLVNIIQKQNKNIAPEIRR